MTGAKSFIDHLYRGSITGSLFVLLVISGCQTTGLLPVGNTSATTAVTTTAHESHENSEIGSSHRSELDSQSPIALNPDQGKEIGLIYEAFLSPQQEGGEEEDTPSLIPSQFRSTAPSVVRNERPSRGHGVLAFTKDLSKAFVYVAIKEVKNDEIVMFHIHCGRPGQLGPIIVDFGLAGDLKTYMADGSLALAITNEDIVAAAAHGQGLVGAFTAGCPIVPAIPLDKVKTIAGLALIAQQGELYFNLHTAGQTFFGDIRGQLYPVTR